MRTLVGMRRGWKLSRIKINGQSETERHRRRERVIEEEKEKERRG